MLHNLCTYMTLCTRSQYCILVLATYIFYYIAVTYMTDHCCILDATFNFSDNFIYEEITALRYTNVFINCSVNPIDAITS